MYCMIIKRGKKSYNTFYPPIDNTTALDYIIHIPCIFPDGKRCAILANTHNTNVYTFRSVQTFLFSATKVFLSHSFIFRFSLY